MEVREYCRSVVESARLEDKLAGPGETLEDRCPGPPLRLREPGRPAALGIRASHETRVPPAEGLLDPEQRPRVLHGLANHELQAAELFAWALLAFPGTPAAFRQGLLRILREEQMHTRLYLRRLEALGASLGDWPVSGYFWNKLGEVRTPAQFLCAMSLTFENANLDHSLAYAATARRAGDEETARLFERIHRDEIGHVRFGWEWLARFKAPGQSMREAYLENVRWPLRPARARGAGFHAASREEAGLDAEFIHMLERGDDR